jgi:diaminohydroxyphosphoribosylaminopyrimidine deaminase/5-amino-6-(5-phosphoribosylamino)uracil reductase
MRDHRPQVLLKLALSADEKVARAGRRPLAITGAAARDRVHHLRAMHDAILIGVGTVITDDPQLTCRLPGMAPRSPIRVVLDTHLRLPTDSTLARTAREVPVWVIAGVDAPQRAEQQLRALGVEVVRAPASQGRVDLAAALNLLAGRGITRLMVEGGPTVAAAFATADLVDEAALLRAPGLVGPDGIAALEGLPLSALTRSPRLKSRAIETVGEDTLELFERA